MQPSKKFFGKGKLLIPTLSVLLLVFLFLLGCTDKTYLIMPNDNIGSTPYGNCFLNSFIAYEDLNRGQIVEITINQSFAVSKASQSNAMPIGVVYENAVKDANVKVCTSGIAYTLFAPSVVPSNGWIAFVSSVDGLADNESTIPDVNKHNAEIGHVLNYGSTGDPAYVELHFN